MVRQQARGPPLARDKDGLLPLVAEVVAQVGPCTRWGSAFNSRVTICCRLCATVQALTELRLAWHKAQFISGRP